jgi:uncharacterized protein YhaN
MRIRSVTAHAFGPLVGQTLELADGMTVVIGENEAAKTSWHAAIYAALCGRRRGKGAPRKDEQRFIDLHKPWDRDDWLVTAQVVLDDDRRIELRNDLAGKVDCHAKDLDLGDDISAEVMNAGSPDGALWLGLDRSSFVATACVEQSQLLGVLAEADGLQEHLQQAAATAGTDATAAAALDLLKAFQRDRVGLDRANAAKPLRHALVGVDRAEARLAAAKHAHAEYLSRLEEVDHLHEKAAAVQLAVIAQEASAASYAAASLAVRQREAEQLDARFGGAQPANLADGDATADAVSHALASWLSAPAMPTMPARSTADIEQEIATLPPVPDGDTVVHDSVRTADERLNRAEAQLQQHDRNGPRDDIAAAPSIAAGDDELLDLARILDTPIPTVPEDLVERELAAQRVAAAEQQDGKIRVPLLIVAAVAVVLGVVLATAGQSGVGAVAILAGVVLAAVALLRRGVAAADGPAVSAHVAAQAGLAAAQAHTVEVQHRHDRAVARCGELGLPAEPDSLRHIPVARARAQAHGSDVQRWTEQRSGLVSELGAAIDEFSAALAGRGHPVTCTDVGALREAVDAYRDSCVARAAQAASSSRLVDLSSQLEAVRSAERRVDADTAQRQAAADKLLAAARLCNVPTEEPEQAVALLTEWQRLRAARVTQLADDQRDWARLHALLDGHTLAELRELAVAAQEKADKLLDGGAREEVLASEAATAIDELPTLREEAVQARSRAAAADGELRQFSASVPSVAEAEEVLESAKGELARVRELQETLRVTTDFLASAQDRVHRSIAPRLAASLRAWLPQVTGGRYTDAIVSPTTLQVQVAGPSGRWRQAELLSYGTAEQVYLLLRAALADHLTNGHDSCPLLLDDVTVHADQARTRDILDLLLQMSKDRQIVLFTQEEQVAVWAREHLTGPDHKVVQLAGPTAA